MTGVLASGTVLISDFILLDTVRLLRRLLLMVGFRMSCNLTRGCMSLRLLVFGRAILYFISVLVTMEWIVCRAKPLYPFYSSKYRILRANPSTALRLDSFDV